MTVKRLGSLAELNRVLRKDMRTLKARVKSASVAAAKDAIPIVQGHAPVAFGEVRDGIQSEKTDAGARIVSTAPHSAAVETGSRPHFPPIEPILAWVKLRGGQGLEVDSGAAGFVAGHIARHTAENGGNSTPVDAAEKVAFMIARGIAKNGTKPTWFMRSSLPDVEAFIDTQVRAALEKAL